MSENGKRSRRPPRKKSGPSTGLIIGLAVGGGLLLLALSGTFLYLYLGTPKLPSLDAALPDLPNLKATAENYDRVKTGETILQVETVLGTGRAANANDLDAVFGEKELGINRRHEDRITWEVNNDRGLVRIWSIGSKRLLVVFSQVPERGGRVVIKLFRDGDGPIQSQADYGLIFGMQSPSNTPVASVGVTQLMAEFNADSKAALKKYQGLKVTVVGPVHQMQEDTVYFYAGPATFLEAKISRTAGRFKRKEDTAVVTGTVRSFSASFNDRRLIMDACTLDN
jgi:hypothetical protein